MAVSSSEQNVRLAHPVYGAGIIPTMSHTYINQYTGSEYNLDKQQVCLNYSVVLTIHFISAKYSTELKKCTEAQGCH